MDVWDILIETVCIDGNDSVVVSVSTVTQKTWVQILDWESFFFSFFSPLVLPPPPPHFIPK